MEFEDDEPDELQIVSRRVAAQYLGICLDFVFRANGAAVAGAVQDMRRLARASKDGPFESVLDAFDATADLAGRRVWLAEMEVVLGSRAELDDDSPLQGVSGLSLDDLDVLARAGIHTVQMLQAVPVIELAQVTGCDPGFARRVCSTVRAVEVAETPPDLLADMLDLQADELDELAIVLEETAHSLFETAPMADRIEEIPDHPWAEAV